jgi:hypothetical protein
MTLAIRPGWVKERVTSALGFVIAGIAAAGYATSGMANKTKGMIHGIGKLLLHTIKLNLLIFVDY